jgi:hypothetical protein
VNTLLDPALGPADKQVSAAIIGICGDALHAVLGPGLAPAALTDSALLTRIAPWARDLARGLQYRDRFGAGDPPTLQLVTRFAGRQLPADQAHRFAETIDLAVVLTLGRVTDQVLGRGSGTRNPVASELAMPWLPTLQLGYRIGLVLELLRLSHPGTLVPSLATPADDDDHHPVPPWTAITGHASRNEAVVCYEADGIDPVRHTG